jgi:23S rRNA-intervening sequence protein
VPANIVEGLARRSRKSRLNCLNIAESSLAEAGYCIHAAYRLGYVSEELRDELEKDIKGVGAPLGGLVRSTKTDLALSVFCLGAGSASLPGSQRDGPSRPSCPSCRNVCYQSG